METIAFLLASYGYIFFVFGVVIEGEIFPLATGWLVSNETLNLYWTLLVTYAGVAIGGILWFKLGERGGCPLLDKWGRILWFSRSRLQSTEQHFFKNGKKTLFVTKFIYSFGHLSILLAGVSKMNFKGFLKIDLLTSLLWSVLFIVVGYFLGNGFWLLNSLIKDITVAVLTVLAVAMIVTFVRNKLVKQVLYLCLLKE